MGGGLDPAVLAGTIEEIWEHDVLPVLSEYTTIACLSPAFAADWESTGELQRAAELLASWCRTRPLRGLQADVVTHPGLTPVVLVQVPPSGGGTATVLIYGHLDKQPPQGAWRAGLGPYQPTREGDLLYGRGTADDGYSVFAALSAVDALAKTGVPHPRVVALIEASEESGSPDLPAHLERLGPIIGRPDLVICLDSGCLTYDRLWLTSSLRGNVVIRLRVDVLGEGVHSGLAGGIVPSSFRLLRRLLARLEDERTGRILLPELHADIPAAHRANLEAVAARFGGAGTGDLPVVDGLELDGRDDTERLVAKAWSPALAVTGMAGIPAPGDAGNVLRPYTEALLSLRLPPTVDARAAGDVVVRALTADPPSSAHVRATVESAAQGWMAPELPAWVTAALNEASAWCFATPAASYGEGGTIPFLAELGRRFPDVALVATGVLGPGSNAHGPNEALHLPMARAVSVAVAHLVAAASR